MTTKEKKCDHTYWGNHETGFTCSHCGDKQESPPYRQTFYGKRALASLKIAETEIDKTTAELIRASMLSAFKMASESARGCRLISIPHHKSSGYLKGYNEACSDVADMLTQMAEAIPED